MRHHAWVSLGLMVAALGCAELVAPARQDSYEFRRLVSKGAEGVDTLVFHWDRASLPVRIYVPANSPLATHVQTAIDRWQAAFLYGEFRAEIVADSGSADVIFENSPPLDGGFLRASLNAHADGCTGATDIPTSFEFALPAHSYVFSNTGTEVPGLDHCYSITVTHELGHALGILNHSPNPGDLMYAFPQVDGLTVRDRETAELLYHTSPTVRITGRQ